MGVTIELPESLRPFAGDTETVRVGGRTIGECFRNLVKAYPPLERWFGFKSGLLVTDLDMLVAVNGKNTYPILLDTPVNEGDRITLLLIITGG
jgi:molybdopterin converting factor small subunit